MEAKSRHSQDKEKRKESVTTTATLKEQLKDVSKQKGNNKRINLGTSEKNTVSII